jgi:hypothetical protein
MQCAWVRVRGRLQMARGHTGGVFDMRHETLIRWFPLALSVGAALAACSGDDTTGSMGGAFTMGDGTQTNVPPGSTTAGGTPTTTAPGTGTTDSTGGPGTTPTGDPTAGASGDGTTGAGGSGAAMGDGTAAGDEATGGTGGMPAGDAPDAGPGDDTQTEPAASCVAADSVDQDGPFTPTHIENGGPSGGSWVFYPEDLGRDGMLHPVFVWGPGAGTGPSQYTDHLNRLASHGFVVISQPSSGSGTTETAALDWMLAQNDEASSPFYQQLDPERVGMGGHSLGSLTTMAMADDPRLTTYVLVCGGCMSGRGGCGAADIHGPTVILGGDGDIGTPNYEGDYSEISSPVVFLTKDDTGHIDCARNNLSPWVAFMRWQLCGESQWQADFFDGGEYCQTPWDCKSKNFQ